MAKRRANGEGNIRKRPDGRWDGRYIAGHDENGKAIRKNVLGRTQAEVKEKPKKAIGRGISPPLIIASAIPNRYFSSTNPTIRSTASAVMSSGAFSSKEALRLARSSIRAWSHKITPSVFVRSSRRT